MLFSWQYTYFVSSIFPSATPSSTSSTCPTPDPPLPTPDLPLPVPPLLITLPFLHVLLGHVVAVKLSFCGVAVTVVLDSTVVDLHIFNGGCGGALDTVSLLGHVLLLWVFDLHMLQVI